MIEDADATAAELLARAAEDYRAAAPAREATVT
ncbi:hypothetical protein SLAV_38855 [Streptomyces lavendulae subsp. lavendulae]|uniref:Uncharacterized protein n=1 Tax=Streptomyces lavendulae subsp. lavendulae TaxID=58340 RepID=A0A2K8PS20_STRLA|nr:hypothetical protein SLAV_00535 [Streptomyces lavendulae subsp. lavendulae]ATZ29534.1 hypothetical protein SLAV_38855 [Streptomyces lavendulae subsp. lavendulae]